MQRTVNTAVSSHNNMLVPEDEIVVERTAYKQEELLKRENEALKEEVRRLGEKLALLQSRLMTDKNHPVHKISSKAGSVRRKSAFTLPCKEPRGFPDTKRHSLQLLPPLKDTSRDVDGSTERTVNLMPEMNENHDATYPLELNPATSLLHSVSMHSRTFSS